MARGPVVVTKSRGGRLDQLSLTLCVPQQPAVLALEPAEERLHLRVVTSPVEGVGQPNPVVQQKPRRPTVAREHGVLILMQDYTTLRSAKPLKRPP